MTKDQIMIIIWRNGYFIVGFFVVFVVVVAYSMWPVALSLSTMTFANTIISLEILRKLVIVRSNWMVNHVTLSLGWHPITPEPKPCDGSKDSNLFFEKFQKIFDLWSKVVVHKSAS